MIRAHRPSRTNGGPGLPRQRLSRSDGVTLCLRGVLRTDDRGPLRVGIENLHPQIHRRAQILGQAGRQVTNRGQVSFETGSSAIHRLQVFVPSTQ